MTVAAVVHDGNATQDVRFFRGDATSGTVASRASQTAPPILAAGQLLDIPQDDRRAVLVGQLVECGGQDGPQLALKRWIVEASRPVGDRLARLALRIDDPRYGPGTSVTF